MVVFANGAISDPSRFMVFSESMLRLWPVMGWGGVGMLTFLELAHILDATQLCYSCAHKHAWCHASCANKHACVFLVRHAFWREEPPEKKSKKNLGFAKQCKYRQKMDLCCPAMQIVWKMKIVVSGLKSKNVEIPTNQVDSCAKEGAFSKGSLTTPYS